MTPASLAIWASDVFRHPLTGQYLAYHKTWIDGIDGGQVWKRAVAVSTSTDFVT